MPNDALTAAETLQGVEWWWVAYHWDYHHNGLVKYQSEMLVASLISTTWDDINWQEYYDDNGHQVKDEPDFVVTYGIFRLSPKTMRKLIQRKEMFELFVGRHWTYENGKRGEGFSAKRKPFWPLYYKVKKWLKRVELVEDLPIRELVLTAESELVGQWKVTY